MQLPRDATAIDFTLVTGNTMAPASISRSIVLGDSHVVLEASGFYGEARQSRAWWEETRTMLDRGLANARSVGSPSESVCEFELRVKTPRGEELLQGSCADRRARIVEVAFRRIAPVR